MERWDGRTRRFAVVLGVTLLAAGLCACGGGGSSSGGGAGALEASAFQWEPPRTYVDNSPLDPAVAIDRYEVFVSSDPAVHPDDEPIAAVSGAYMDGVVVKPVTSFDLRNLDSLLPPGAACYVSVRAVGTDNQVSDRTVPIEWLPEA